MSYCTMLINQRTSLPLKSNVVVDRINYGKLQRRKVVVCCCPWSEKNKLVVPQNKNTIPTPLESFKAKYPVSGISKNNYPFPFNFVSYLLSIIINKRSGKQGQTLPPTLSLLHLILLLSLYHILRLRPMHYFLRDLANKYGPLVYLKLGERSVAIVSSAEMAKEMMRTHDPAYAGRPNILGSQILSYNESDILFHQYDEYWKQMRKLCISEFLSNKKVGSLEHIWKEEGSALIESIQTGVPFNLSEKIDSYTFTVLCRAMFGRVGVDDKREALISIREALDMTGIISLIDLFPSNKALNYMSWHKRKLQKSKRQLDNVLEGLIDFEQRSKDGGEHFIDVLLRSKESGELQYPLTEDNIKSLVFDMIIGGTNTSSSVADWAMAELLKNPNVMAKAQDEIRQAFQGKKTIQEGEIGRLKYLKLVIMETLRLHPSIPLTLRSCREEVEVNGYHIPLNTFVVINTWAIGRDPTYWKNPESFEPERFEANPVDFSGAHFEFLPFGSGRRICPGKTFALAQVEFILAQLLYQFDWELPPDINPDDLDMTVAGKIIVYRKTPLYLVAKPYFANSKLG